jgi:hypothetical protein
MKKFFRYSAYMLAFLFTTAISMELVLRLVFGFCNAPLYRSDKDYEYFPQPNQNRFRFFSHFKTNSYGMRSEEPDSTKTRVLGLGDSVIYGGTWMDQDSLATTHFTSATGIQMLNISAGSWGPDNCAAYLRQHGTFGASAMLLVCSSHDAYDVMTFIPIVGVLNNYPEHQYTLALQELYERYFFPIVIGRIYSWLGIAPSESQYVDPDVQVERNADNRQVIQKGLTFNPGFDELKKIANSCHIPLIIYLHAEKGELADGSYNDMGETIIHWCDTASVKLILGINSETADMYHDAIHFNTKGQRHLAETMKKELCSTNSISR